MSDSPIVTRDHSSSSDPPKDHGGYFLMSLSPHLWGPPIIQKPALNMTMEFGMAV